MPFRSTLAKPVAQPVRDELGGRAHLPPDRREPGQGWLRGRCRTVIPGLLLAGDELTRQVVSGDYGAGMWSREFFLRWGWVMRFL